MEKFLGINEQTGNLGMNKKFSVVLPFRATREKPKQGGERNGLL